VEDGTRADAAKWLSVYDSAEEHARRLQASADAPGTDGAVTAALPGRVWSAAIARADSESVDHVSRDLKAVEPGLGVKLAVVAHRGHEQDAALCRDRVKCRCPCVGFTIDIDAEIGTKTETDDRIVVRCQGFFDAIEDPVEVDVPRVVAGDRQDAEVVDGDRRSSERLTGRDCPVEERARHQRPMRDEVGLFRLRRQICRRRKRCEIAVTRVEAAVEYRHAEIRLRSLARRSSRRCFACCRDA
jgi:hypothetical protein